MRHWIVHWLLSGVALLIGSALIAALVIGFVSATVGFLLKIVLLPFIFLTLGLVYFLINGLMLKLASGLVPDFACRDACPLYWDRSCLRSWTTC